MALDIGAPLSIRVNPRARRLLLKVDASSRAVELVLPYGVPAEHGLRFLAAQRGWIAARLDALPNQVQFMEGAIVPVLGVPHRICGASDPTAPPVAIVDGEIRVRGDPAHIGRRVRDHLARLAGQEFSRRARAFAGRIDRKVARVTVRDTTSRWGSCSAAGNLSFSWRLILAPEPVIDYVVAHELSHLRVMDHSPKFWDTVASVVPDYRHLRGQLKDEALPPW